MKHKRKKNIQKAGEIDFWLECRRELAKIRKMLDNGDDVVAYVLGSFHPKL